MQKVCAAMRTVDFAQYGNEVLARERTLCSAAPAVTGPQ